VVYVPYYMRQMHSNSAAMTPHSSAAFGYLRLVNPALAVEDLLASHVGRLRYAQPVCQPGFLAALPKVVTPIDGLQIADTCFCYPEDRGISESVRYGRLMAAGVTDPSMWALEGR
jgi:hypothetical protein